MSGKSQFEGAVITLLDRIADAQEAANTADGAGGYDSTYIFPAKDFGGGTFVEVIQGPAGLRGVVKNVTIYDVTEIFEDGTSIVTVGVDGGDVDSYAIGSAIGTLGVAASISLTLTAGVTGTIPAAASVGVTGTLPGGTPTGIATVAVTISWFI